MFLISTNYQAYYVVKLPLDYFNINLKDNEYVELQSSNLLHMEQDPQEINFSQCIIQNKFDTLFNLIRNCISLPVTDSLIELNCKVNTFSPHFEDGAKCPFCKITIRSINGVPYKLKDNFIYYPQKYFSDISVCPDLGKIQYLRCGKCGILHTNELGCERYIMMFPMVYLITRSGIIID